MAKKVKIRTQLRLGDVYRKIVTNDLVEIKHIDKFTFHAGTLVVKFDNYERRKFDCVNNNGVFDEKLLRNAIKEINKYISEVH